MRNRASLVVLAATVVLLAFPCELFAAAGIIAGGTFRTQTISLDSFVLGGRIHPAGTYSFKIVGTGKPGKVEVRVLNSAGKQVGVVPGQFAGSCPGKPTKTTFANLGFSKSSVCVKLIFVIGINHILVHPRF